MFFRNRSGRIHAKEISAMPTSHPKKYCSTPWWTFFSFDIFFILRLDMSILCGWRHLVVISAQNWPKPAISAWHCLFKSPLWRACFSGWDAIHISECCVLQGLHPLERSPSLPWGGAGVVALVNSWVIFERQRLKQEWILRLSVRAEMRPLGRGRSTEVSV